MATASDGRVVVLTGANGGIGYHMLRTMVADGYRVAGLDIDGDNLEPLQETDPGQVRYYDCDVTDAEDVDAAVADVIDTWGRIDILVNNAGIAAVAPFEKHSIEETRREFEVNYFGYQRMIRAVLPQMRAQGGGLVHNVSSGTALGGHPGMTGYASTKGAIEALVRSLRLEFDDEDIAFTLMHPQMVATRMTADLDYPEWVLSEPAEVGRKLAGKIESTAPVIVTDWQTKFGLYLIQRVPWLWRKATVRCTDLPE
jgi:NAD(P)-dependent dehydrogenase (short-subunit alcohol dehydrogenase family)